MLMSVLGQLMLRHADDYPQIVDVGQEQRIVAQVKEYLENHYAEEVTLDDLVRLTHLSRYHLIRVFSGSVGVPPHAYLRQVRIRRAKEQLARGAGITDVALAAGFTDQSHLTRWFKRLWGITPAVYRNSVQDTSF
jgi:AraC-like DNA-binding protein